VRAQNESLKRQGYFAIERKTLARRHPFALAECGDWCYDEDSRSPTSHDPNPGAEVGNLAVLSEPSLLRSRKETRRKH